MSVPIVVKVGGALLGEQVDRRAFWKQVAGLGPAVVVHGGGPQLTAMAERLGHTPRMVQGRRVTGPHDLDIVRWVLRGELSTLLVSEALACGVRAVGVCAADADMVRVTRRPPWNVDGEEVDFGFVGDVERVDAHLLCDLLAAGYTPIVTPMGRDAAGQIYNVNADTIAAALAGALGAEALLLVTEAAAVQGARGERLPELSARDVDVGKTDGWIAGGMRVKVDVALHALAGGTRSVWICGPEDIAKRQRATRIYTEPAAPIGQAPSPSVPSPSVPSPRVPSATDHTSEVLALHRELVSIPSLSRQEAAAADYLEAWFRAHDIDVVRYEDNVVASVGGGGRTLLLNSHLDVVPPSSDHPFPPFNPVVHEDAVWGRGAVDAKGCVAAMAAALVAWSRRTDRPPGRVVAAFTTCEELGGAENGLEDILPKLGPLDAALVGEPTHMQPCTAQKGLLILKLVARGQAAHAARATEGDNAITKAAEAIRRLETLRFAPDDPLLGAVSCVPTVVEGGAARNVVPDASTVWLDIRSTPTWPHDRIRAHVAAHMGRLVDVEVHSERLHPVGTPEAEDIVQACVHGAGRGGQVPFGSPTVSDWVHLRALPAVKIGPGDSRLSHTPREHLPIAELEAAVPMYMGIIKAYISARPTQNHENENPDS